MHTFTMAGLIRNLAPEFIAFLASSTLRTVPTCKILGEFRRNSKNSNQVCIWIISMALLLIENGMVKAFESNTKIFFWIELSVSMTCSLFDGLWNQKESRYLYQSVYVGKILNKHTYHIYLKPDCTYNCIYFDLLQMCQKRIQKGSHLHWRFIREPVDKLISSSQSHKHSMLRSIEKLLSMCYLKTAVSLSGDFGKDFCRTHSNELKMKIKRYASKFRWR